MRADKTLDGSSNNDTAVTAEWIRSVGIPELLADALCAPLMAALTRGATDTLSRDARKVGQLAYLRELGAQGDHGTCAALLAPALNEIPKLLQRTSLHVGLDQERAPQQGTCSESA